VKFSSTVLTKIKDSNRIAIIGNGGNLAIARHVASDMTRHLDKFCFAPEAVHLTALGGDGPWHHQWVCQYAKHADLIIGITTRINSPIAESLDGRHAILIAPMKHWRTETIIIEEKTYHEFEVQTLSTCYDLMEELGAELPKITI
jgi:hypothetical protein